MRSELPRILYQTVPEKLVQPSNEMELRERMVRVEEELKHQRELMMEGFKRIDERFESIDKRFADLIHYMDQRFEAVDKRFEDLIRYMDKRFESMDRRFSFLQWTIMAGFSGIGLFLGIITYLARANLFP